MGIGTRPFMDTRLGRTEKKKDQKMGAIDGTTDVVKQKIALSRKKGEKVRNGGLSVMG